MRPGAIARPGHTIERPPRRMERGFVHPFNDARPPGVCGSGTDLMRHPALCNPFGVTMNRNAAIPGCASRPWAALCNAFGVSVAVAGPDSQGALRDPGLRYATPSA